MASTGLRKIPWGGLQGCWWSFLTLFLNLFYHYHPTQALCSTSPGWAVLALLSDFRLFSLPRTPLCLLFSLSSVQSLSHVWLSVTPWTAARQASLSITYSQSLFKLMSATSVMPSNHLILCHPLLLLPSVFPSIRVFSNESTLRMR